MVIENQVVNRTISSPNYFTSDIEDAFSSMNILNYTSVSSDYFPVSLGSNSFNSSENSNDNMIPPVFSSFYNNTYLKDVQAIYAKELPISSPNPITLPAILIPSPVLPPSLLFDPQIFEIGKCSNKMYLKHHEKQVEDILNYLDELYLHRIERMEEGRINGNELKTELKEIRTQIIRLQKKRMPPKRTSTSETPPELWMPIRQLTVDFYFCPEAQTSAAMANARAVVLIRWFDNRISIPRSRCARKQVTELTLLLVIEQYTARSGMDSKMAKLVIIHIVVFYDYDCCIHEVIPQISFRCYIVKMGVLHSVCDVPLCNNPTPLEPFKEHSETIINSNNDYSSSDDDSYENTDYVDASPPDAEIVSLEVVEIVIPEVGGIDTDILLTIKDDILHEKLLNVNLLIANIEALKDNPTPSSDAMTKYSIS
ncbi:hypothetical protein Tco_1371381 [Tanacetum coccineum]